LKRKKREEFTLNLDYSLAGSNTDWKIGSDVIGEFEYINPGGFKMMLGVKNHLLRSTPEESDHYQY